MADYVVPHICKPTLDVSTSSCYAAGNLQEQYVAQALDISGAPINIFKLLGVHEQGVKIDLAKNGQPIAKSSQPGYNISNVFNSNPADWRSVEVGPAVTSTYIGYNFGTKKLDTGGEKYNPPAPIYQHITSFSIQQSSNLLYRVTQVRIERSNDGVQWHVCDVVNLPDNADLNFVKIKSSAPAQRWRVMPTLFNGGIADFWEVSTLELYDYETTDLSNIQDKFLLENRDRSYSQRSVMIKTQYDIQDDQVDLSRFGIQLANQFRFTAAFSRLVEKLGRPVVIGDILELPAEIMFDKNLNLVHRWLEITDVAWDPQGFTTDWRPTLMRFTAEPLLASQETRDLIGWSTDADTLQNDILGLNNSPLHMSTLADDADENIKVAAADAVPEKGEDATSISSQQPYVPQDRDPTYDGIQNTVEDGLPPDNAPYTEGQQFPASPTDGVYHRLTYEPQFNINPRLHRFSIIKNRWIFIEEDRRGVNSSFKAGISSIMKSANKRPLG